MARSGNSTAHLNEASLVKRMLAGAGIGLLLISLFLLSAGKPDPEWERLWMIRPLIIVPLSGAMGGLCNFFILQFHQRAGLNKVLAMIISVIVFIVGLWLGTVLGLDGTMWS
jgi:heme A synthase